MSETARLLEPFFQEIERHNRNRRHGEEMPADYYEPGDMEYMDRYFGSYDDQSHIAVMRTEVKGLRYEGRTVRLEKLSVGDVVFIERDPENPYNANNFLVRNETGENLGNLSALLCNALAPAVDAGLASIIGAKVSYLEHIGDRSRYARQGVLFLEVSISVA